MRSQLIDKLWYQHHPIKWLLYPFSIIFGVISHCRRVILTRFFQENHQVPIIVVGNLTVGGVGKTPLVITLANQLKEKGIQVGIVTRGYGSKISFTPHLVQDSDDAFMVGDEPLLIAEKTKCPVVISPDRNRAINTLIKEYHCELIISDDGLQHYKMGRQIEIAVIDGSRGFGNGLLLPAGPLRESESRLKSVDFIVVNHGERPGAYRLDLKPGIPTMLGSNHQVAVSDMTTRVAAVAGIGNPARFFKTLDDMNIPYNAYPYPDHFQYKKEQFKFSEPMILMTEKDAVKCRVFATDNMYYLPVEAELEKSFWPHFWRHIALRDFVSYEN